LTSGGCCVQPAWSPDGSQVWYIDRPDPNSASGVWGVNVSGGAPQLVTDRLGLYSPDRSLIAYPERGRTYIERIGGERWVAPSEGRSVSFSPDGARIAWQVNSSSANFDRRVTEVWISNVDGSGARRVAQLIGGGFSGWFPDGQRLLVSGRESAEVDPYLASLSIDDGALTVIARGERLRGGTPSPGGGWIAYQVTFSSDPAQDGVWAVRTDGRALRRLDVFGAYRWRAEGRLMLVPLEMDAPSHRLLEVEVATGQVRALTDPGLTPFRMEGGDWTLSPHGDRVAFVSAEDRNIWLIEGLP
jgi:Tol biopolymer transport system component